jgi:PAS domain S-box-containing protein
MKINMPVTDTEISFSENETLVSKTDLKGTITYVNKEFIKISGFTEEELIGKNHNIVRHPEMPPEAFADLWETLKAGKPWIQMVKNRCKNGDYYWVKANVTPVFRNGQVVEYMSVRAKPTREEIDAAEKAFLKLKNGKIKLTNGNIEKSGLSSITAKFGHLNIKTQYAVLTVMFVFLVGLISWQLSIQKENVDFSSKELLGTEYITPMRQLLEFVPQHRGMTNAFLSGDRSFESKILQTRQGIDKIFNEAFAVDSRIGAALDTTSYLKDLQNQWNTIKSSAFSMEPQDSFQRHSKLIADIQALIVHAGDTSNLILDPDLDSYYSMDLVINKIPQLVELMGQARGLGAGVIAKGHSTEKQQDRLIELTVALDFAEKGVEISYNSGASASAEVKTTLEAQAQAAEHAITAFITKVKQVRGKSYSGNSQEFFEAGTQAISESFKLYDQSADLLNMLLERRVNHLSTVFYIILALTVIAVLLVSIIGFVTSRNMLFAIQESLNSFRAIANGDYKYDIAMVGDNEISELTRAINSMRIKLGFDLEDAAAKGAETKRIKEALDVCTTNVMVADGFNNVIYMNHSIHEMFSVAEEEIKKDLPHFDAKKLMGANMDIFHKNPAHQKSVIDKIREPYKAEIKIGARTFSLTATPVFGENNERMGTVVEWLDRTEILAREEQERRIANENARIKQALDNVSANVMVADNDRNIIYLNQAVIDTMKFAEASIRRDLPNFSVDKLLGGSIDSFHKNPEHQKNLLANLKGEHKASLIIGGRHMDLVVNPVNNEQGVRLGTVVEWKDRTDEIAIEQQIDNLVGSAAAGDLTQRISMEGKTGFFAKLSEGLNTLVESANSILTDVGNTFSAMAEGDLTNVIHKAYQGDFERIRGDANLTIEKLTDVISKIREAASTVNTAANEIAQGNADLSQRTEEQASSLEETASSMEQMTSTVKHSADSAHEANTLASDARRRAQEGGDVVKQAVDAMAEILKSSNKINDIIGVIDEIAFQTNLLALNAAVEAARAGEQGRGFAVVAGEVRNLSQRSAAAAKEIKDLIKDSVTKVEAGSVLVNDSGTTLTSIVQAVEKVAGMIAEISNASAEQTSGIEQINQAVSQMDEMTQQNAALVEEASAASEAMSEQANNMSRLVGFFRLGDMHNDFHQSPVKKPQEKIVGYKPSSTPTKSTAGTKTKFAEDDEWEDF